MRILLGVFLIIAPWTYWVIDCLPALVATEHVKAEEIALAKIWIGICAALSIAGVWLIVGRRKLTE